MHKLCFLFAFALISQAALGFRLKRQTENGEEDLEDRYGWNRPGRFPPPNWQRPRPRPTPSPTTTNTPPTSGPTTVSAALQGCRQTCLVTPEYNPVCGSNNVTYDNPGRLLCDQACGVNVTQTRASRCPNAVIPPVA